jgi:TspO/MBR family
MNATTHTESPPGSRHRDAVRLTAVVASAIVAIIGSFIGSGAAGGIPIQDASNGALAADATLVAPGAPAFSVWSVIYAGLVAYAIWQALPAQRTDARQRRLGYLVAVSLILNAAWIVCVQAGLLGFSVPVIVVLLADLAWVFVILVRSRPKDLVETIITDGTMGLYLGWVCVATAANISAVLVAIGFRGFGLEPEVWAITVIGVAGLVGIGLAMFGRGRLAPAASVIWGLVWIAVARLGGDLHSTPTAIAALVAAAAVLVITVALRLRTGIRPGKHPAIEPRKAVGE